MISVLIDLVNYAGLVLVPLIPAYILFRNLRGGAFVSGKLKGWNVKLTGSIAGYFALLLLLLPIFWPRSTYEVWMIEGPVDFEQKIEDGGNTSIPPSSNVIFTLNPPNPIIGNTEECDYAFLMAVPVNRTTELKKIPNLTIYAQNYIPETINLDKRKAWSAGTTYKIDVKRWKKRIEILDPILITLEGGSNE